MNPNRRIYSSKKDRLFLEEQMMSTDENFCKAYPMLSSYFTFLKNNPNKFTKLTNNKFKLPKTAVNSKKVKQLRAKDLNIQNQSNIDDSFFKKQFKVPFTIKEPIEPLQSSKDLFITRINSNSTVQGLTLENENQNSFPKIKPQFFISSITSPFIRRVGLMNAFSEITKQNKDKYIDRSLINKIYKKLKPRTPLVNV